ncbi:MAG: hypothetical protein J6M05_04445 [Cardiobacteriaceae bacterium]|nr:hypothetical protein [Cardiobacteriaceae bacterium]
MSEQKLDKLFLVGYQAKSITNMHGCYGYVFFKDKEIIQHSEAFLGCSDYQAILKGLLHYCKNYMDEEATTSVYCNTRAFIDCVSGVFSRSYEDHLTDDRGKKISNSELLDEIYHEVKAKLADLFFFHQKIDNLEPLKKARLLAEKTAKNTYEFSSPIGTER